MPMTEFDRLYDVLRKGRDAAAPGQKEDLRALIEAVFKERYDLRDFDRFQVRTALMPGDDQAAWAGLILADNPTSGVYNGTSFVWFPGEDGSVAVLVIGTGGFGPDSNILARPGHRRRLRAMQRLNGAHFWVKPDLLDLASAVPDAVTAKWPRIDAAVRTYGRVIYAAVPVEDAKARQAVLDLLDLFAHEHRVRFKGGAKDEWKARRTAMLASLFPRRTEAEVAKILEERRFVILQGPPGTGKTRLGLQVSKRYGEPTTVQFHPARTYEDFVVGLAPRPTGEGLAFEVREGDLLRANAAARGKRHALFIDEINRGDLARILGEAIYLFEAGEPDREVELAHAFGSPPGRRLKLERGLLVLGTLNTADKSIAHVDLAIRRRFAFLDVHPDLDVVRAEGVELARRAFEDVLDTFSEHADDSALALIPGHAYFLDPRPDESKERREARVARRLRFELLPLLRTYVEERLVGSATGEVAGLTDRIEALLAEAGA